MSPIYDMPTSLRVMLVLCTICLQNGSSGVRACRYGRRSILIVPSLDGVVQHRQMEGFPGSVTDVETQKLRMKVEEFRPEVEPLDA